jgi:phytoene dehydrogenase-like protein
MVHSARSDSMPFWDKTGWKPIQEYYGGDAKQGLKRCIEALTETSFSELDTLDHLSLREWMSKYSSDEGVYQVWEAISVLEQITFNWWEHSASENLFARKLHYERKRTAGYSFWPMGGWESLWKRVAAAFEGLGGTLYMGEKVERVVVRDGAVHGVELRGHDEPLEAAEVVVNAPVWDMPALFDEGALPWDLLQRIKLLANNKNKACWIGYWIAAEEPVIASSELEMASFFATPRTGLPGFTLNFTGYDPGVSPKGEYLTCFGAAFDATQHYGDKAWLDKQFADLWLDIEDMLPAARGALWKKPHLVTTYGVICKPGLVGATRPDAMVRGVDGLWLTGDTTRARGIGVDKAARSGLTTAEAVLGRRLDFFADSVRY